MWRVYFLYCCSSLSPFNAVVKTKIVMDICADENSKYTEKQVKGKLYCYSIFLECLVLFTLICLLLAAVQLKYEALHRTWKVDESDQDRIVRRAMEKVQGTKEKGKQYLESECMLQYTYNDNCLHRNLRTLHW